MTLRARSREIYLDVHPRKQKKLTWGTHRSSCRHYVSHPPTPAHPVASLRVGHPAGLDWVEETTSTPFLRADQPTLLLREGWSTRQPDCIELENRLLPTKARRVYVCPPSARARCYSAFSRVRTTAYRAPGLNGAPTQGLMRP